MKKLVFLFPGQGSQTVGMGRDFCDSFLEAREVFEEGDSLLERSLSKILFEGPDTLLTETHNSQTGIYLTSMAILKVLQSQFPELTPSICSGHSLGEYSALTAAGKIPFVTCLPLVQFRGTAMQEACQKHPGGMAAILGLSAGDVEEMVASLNLPDDLWVANFNSPGQTVISGTQKGIEVGIEAAKTRGAKRALPLQVHGAFHSGLMRTAEARLAPEIERVPMEETPISVVMNVPGNFVEKTSQMRSYLTQQVTSPVRWEQGIRAMGEVDLFLQIGPGPLAGLNKRIGVDAPTLSIEKVSDIEKIAEKIS